MTTAQTLLTDGVYSYDPGDVPQPNATQTPGYPLFLAGIFALVPHRDSSSAEWARHARPLVIFAQMLMVLGIVASITQAGRLLGGQRMALAAGVLAALYLPFGLATSVMLSDLLGTLLVAGALALAIRLTSRRQQPLTRHFVLFGVLAGAIAMVRPAYAPWTAIPLLYMAIARIAPWKDFARHLAVFAISALLIIAPWWIRNLVTLGEFVPLNTNGGVTMLDSLGGRELTPAEELVAQRAESEGGDGGAVVAWSRLALVWRIAPSEFLRQRTLRAWAVATNPWNPILDVHWENANHWDDERIDYGEFPDAPSGLLLALQQTTTWYQWVLWIAAVVGVFFVRRAPRLLLAASLPVYSIAAHWVTLYNDRYFLPAVAGVIVLAAAGILGGYMTVRESLC